MLQDATPAYSEHTIPKFDICRKYLMINVNSIDTTAVPGYAIVTIGLLRPPKPAPINTTP